MAERSGISGLPNFINLVMIVGILSAATADVYFTSRCLETLASEGLTWRFLGMKPLELAGQMASPEQQNKGLIHVTWPRLIAVLFACVPGLLALMSLGSGSDTFFQFLIAAATTAAIIPWIVICVTYFYFRSDLKKWNKYNNAIIEPSSRSVFQPYLAIYGGVGSAFAVIIQTYETWPGPNREAPVWQYSMSSWTVIVFFVLVVLWRSFREKRAPYKRSELDQAGKLSGKAPKLEPAIHRIRLKENMAIILGLVLKENGMDQV